ncbi:MAG: toll/interleukin-1 receptor domain-containing protein, partial [Bacteroidales bacterium]|nr:toll/interleukin-1 receptor domain-containing protein [Bacteroidales bacterium]
MAAKKKYDFFISYRRANNGTVCGSYLVGLLSDYNVFYDVDSITEGTFDTQIREALQNTERFILVVTEGSFDRPEVPGKRDWYYEEIGLAIETVGLDRITPVVFSGTFNEDILPESLKNRGLRSCQVVKYVAEYAKYFKDEFFHHFGLDNTAPAKNVQSPTREQVEDDQYAQDNEQYDDDTDWDEIDIDEIMSAAKNGNAAAQVALGNCYYNGDRIDEDYEKAVKWYKKAANQGNFQAQNNLGECYRDGEGVEEDIDEAIKWFTLAAEQGDADAQNNLGDCYYNGTGVPEDTNKAFDWYIKAAGGGNTDAQNSLGEWFRDGEDGEPNYTEAIKWFRLAAKQENTSAQVNLG